MPPNDASSTKDFQTVRQEKTLALAQVLQACTERSGAPTGVLCDSVTELQRCIAPLMCLNGDEIVEASLLEPAGKEVGMAPTSEEEAILLGKEPKLPEAPEATSFQNTWRSVNPQSRLTLLLPLLLHLPCPHLAVILPRRKRNPGKGLRLTQTMLESGSTPTCRRTNGCLTGEGIQSLFCSKDEHLVMSKSKGWPAGKPWLLGHQLHSWKRMVGGPLHLPGLVCWDERTLSPKGLPRNPGLQSGAM